MLIATFTGALCVTLFIERVLNAIIYTLMYTFGFADNSARGVAGMGLIQRVIVSCISVLSRLLAVTIQTFQSLVQWSMVIVLFVFLAGALFIVFEFSGHFMVAASDTWNTALGPSAQVLLIWPLRIINYLAHALVPVWNAVIWIWKKVPNQILAQIITNDMGTLIASLQAVVAFCKASAMSIVAWVGAFVCCDEPDGLCNPRCYEAGERILDLLTPMASLRQIVAYSTVWIKNLCITLSGPLDVVTYPFMDINFAKGVHLIVNAIIYTFTHLPAVTTQRCTDFGSVSSVMCIPDFEPVFQMATSGLRYIGMMFDNWLDVIVLIVEASLGRDTPECTSIPNLLADQSFQTTFFGANATIIAGMTPNLFARTDGWGVQYFSMSRDWQTILHPSAFPFPVDVSYGVASVAHINDLHHAPDGDDTMALLGCACFDGVENVGMVIECGVAVFDDQTGAATRRIPVEFQLASTARYLACSKVKIKLQSLRWPATRNTATRIPAMDGSSISDFTCISKGTCLQVDAALWVRPMCAVDVIDPVCIASFKDAGCFPYCMALHLRGTATQPMILHDAREWGEGVTQLRRDCGLFEMKDPLAGGSATPSPTLPPGETTKVVLPGSPYGLNMNIPFFSQTNNCTYNPTTHSITPRSTSYATYGSITLESQPFAFAGDIALVSRNGPPALDGSATYIIEVQRVFGNQQNEFTMVTLPQEILSSAPCTTPSDCGNVIATCAAASGCLPAIPYSWDAHPAAHIPATVTERYVFYVTNPSLEPFEAFSYYCVNARRNNSYTNKFQISAISSYGGIRLWRLNPYLYCPLDARTGRRFCPQSGSAGTVQIEPLVFTNFSVEMCTQQFSVMAVGLDYINEDNIALTVLRTTLDNIDTQTLRVIDPSRATYPILWVNPITMQWRENKLWMPEAASPALTDAQLCPSQRRTPNVGSILAESIVSMILLVRLPLNIVLGMPVVMELINDNCPKVTAGHSLLKSCGSELISLQDFFHSIYRANALLFQGLAIVADGFGPGFPQTFINGFAMVAENGPYTPILPGFAKQLSQIGHIDPSQALKTLQSTVAALPGSVQIAKAATHQPLAMAQFIYTTAARMLIRILQTVAGGRTIGNLFWSTFADSITDYEVMVSSRQLNMCGGLSVMAGSSSPIGIITNRWCRASVSLESALLTMVTVFTVDVPMFACVCKDSLGSNFRTYVLEKCYPDAPDSYKPLLVHLLAQFSDDPSQVCPQLVSLAQVHFTGALDETFSDINAGTNELASVIDSFIQSIDPKAGDCDNFQDNPYVMALIPQPVDYFRVCGLTAFCRTMCLDEFLAFESANNAPAISETVVETVRSPFFTKVDEDSRFPFTKEPVALIELPDCSDICGATSQSTTDRSIKDRCLLAAGEALGTGQVEVRSYCIPIDITSSVRSGQSAVLESFPLKTTGAAFVWRPDYVASGGTFWASYKLLAMTTDAMYECQSAKCNVLYTLRDLGPDVSQLSGFVTLGNTIIQKTRYLDGVLPYSTSPRIYAYTLVNIYQWIGPSVSSSNLWPDSDYAHVVCAVDAANLCPRVMLIPRMQTLPGGIASVVRVCSRQGLDMIADCAELSVSKNFVYQASIPAASNWMAQTSAASASSWSVFLTVKQVTHWLKVSTISVADRSAIGHADTSFKVPMSVTIQRQCSIENCVGCSSLSVQQICYAAQQCQLARCIGTMVHLRRPLCAIGMNIASIIRQQTSLVHGAWLVISETMVAVLSASGGISMPTSVAWPDQAFYGFICSAKDVSATGIAIVMSSINGVVQSVKETPMADASAHTVDNKALALFTMTSASLTNFLSQMALAPLYTLIAVQKTFVCSANSVLSTMGVNSITIGDPGIQTASSRAAGRCMTQYTAEDTQGGGDKTSKSITAAAVGVLGLGVGLEVLMHPMDATLTWLQGCVLGLQDVVQTLSRSRWAPWSPSTPESMTWRNFARRCPRTLPHTARICTTRRTCPAYRTWFGPIAMCTNTGHTLARGTPCSKESHCESNAADARRPRPRLVDPVGIRPTHLMSFSYRAVLHLLHIVAVVPPPPPVWVKRVPRRHHPYYYYCYPLPLHCS
jgi:hypothetical protein